MFLPILYQMLLFFSFVAIGFALMKGKLLPNTADATLSKLLNVLFLPALVLGAYMQQCTPQAIASVWKALLFGVILFAFLLPTSYGIAKWIFKDDYLRRIGQYGLTISNISFMGNALMASVFQDVFFEYSMFILPVGFASYFWGIPALLAYGEKGKDSPKEILKKVFNPTVVAMLVGIAIGLSGLKMPSVITSIIHGAGECMSPIAMLLTGVVIAKTDVFGLLKQWRLYIMPALRLLVYPLVYIGVCVLLPLDGFFSSNTLLCGMCMMSLPMGLNAVVIPTAYGKDASVGAAMTLISSVFAIGTMPLMFWIFQTLVL